MFGLIARKIAADYGKIILKITLKLVVDLVILTCNYVASKYSIESVPQTSLS